MLDLVSGIEANVNHEYIEELINRQESILKVLRLLCLYSQVSNGLKQKVLDTFKREILQVLSFSMALKNGSSMPLCLHIRPTAMSIYSL